MAGLMYTSLRDYKALWRETIICLGWVTLSSRKIWAKNSLFVHALNGVFVSKKESSQSDLNILLERNWVS